MNVDDILNGALRLGVWPLGIAIVAIVVMLAAFQRVFPALAVGAIAGLLTFVVQAQGA